MKINNWKLFYNPFLKIAGMQAFILGLIVVLISTIIGFYGKLQFDSVADVHIIEVGRITNSLIYSFSGLIVFIIIMILTAFILKSDFRIIDIAGTLTLAKAPYLIISLLSLIVVSPDVSLIISAPLTILKNIPFLLFSLLMIPISIWVVALMFNAFKVSTGLKGGKLIGGFIIGFIVSEIISKILIYIFFKQL